jgi:SAM-dependent methyltransferase
MAERIACPSCDTIRPEGQASLQELGSYRLYYCNACDLEYWHPRALDAAYYETSLAYAEHKLGSMPLQKWHRAFFRHFRAQKGARLLDIGCGDGAFLEAARANGFYVSGVEQNRSAVHAARERRHLPDIFAGGLDAFVREQGNSLQGTFDVVTCFEVIEHQAELTPFFEAIQLLLRPGGWIAGSVPNRSRLMVKREKGDYPPHHFSYWSRQAMENCLTTHGYCDITTAQHAGLEDSAAYLEVQLLGSMGEKLKRFVKSRYLKDANTAVDALSVSAIRELTGTQVLGLEALRKLRFLVFSLPAILSYPWIRSTLYFQAQFEKGLKPALPR